MTDATTPDLATRRALAAAAWNLDEAIVLVAAGEPIPKPGKADQVYFFIPHSDYFWLADRARPGSVLAFDPKEGWFDFVPPVTQAERVWEGGGETEGIDVAELESFLAAREGRPVVVLGGELSKVEGDAARAVELEERLLHARRPKEPAEVERIREAVQATAAGFAAAQEWLRPGVTERQLQIELEAAFQRAGADRPAYDTIIGGGPNSAILHFPPSDRPFREGEVVLIDAGAEVDGYCADVTRTYWVGKGLEGIERDLWQLVLETEEAAVDRCRPGVEYRDIHMGAALQITHGLVDLGLLKGDPESLLERHAQAMFFPHGVGHLVGLGVRDASGYLPGRERQTDPTSQYLRLDLPLQPGYCVTIEPGVYFIPALLDDPENRDRYRDDVDWDKVDALKGFGGVRIEDDVVVTDDEPDNLTVGIPKSV